MPKASKMSRRRALLLTTAVSSAMTLYGVSASAQSSVDVSLLDEDYTRLVTATSEIDNYQIDEAAEVSATAEVSGGVGVTVINDISVSGDSTVTGTYDEDSNSIYGEAYSNLATNTISVTTSPSFSESSALANTQVNTGDGSSGAVTATASSAQITTEIDSSGSTVGTLSGTVGMDNNAITTSANGNTATNTITIADATSLEGAGSGATTTLNNADLGATGGTGDFDLVSDADLVIANAQINDPSGGAMDIDAITTGSDISADIEAIQSGSVLLSGNALSATARGNNVTSTVQTGDNAAEIDTSIAVSSLQANDNTTVDAAVSGGTIEILIDESSGSVDLSTLSLNASRVAASAYGNNATQTLSLDANAINAADGGLATIGSSTGSGDALTVTGQATVANLQLANNADVTATVQANDVEISIADSDNSGSVNNTVTLSNTVVDATAVNNRGVSQAVSLTGNDVGAEVAVASQQYTDSGSATTATASDNDILITEDSLGVSGTDPVSGGAASSTLTLSDSLTRALAIGNAGSTSITVDANDVSLTSASGNVTWDRTRDYGSGDLASVEAAYATLIDQVAEGDVTATVDVDNETEINVSGSVNNVMIELRGNDALAAALGNDAANAISLTVNDLDTSGGSASGYAPVAAAVSQQTLSDNTITAQAIPQTEITLDSTVDDSSIQTSGNSVSTLAIGNRNTGNTLTVNANALDTAPSSGSVGALDAQSNDSVASLLATSVQTISGATIVSSLTDDANSSGGFNPTDSAEIETIVAGTVTNSTVGTDSNILRATLTGNDAVNGVDVTAGSSVASSTGTQNYQSVTGSELNAVVGVAGVLSFTYGAYTFNGSTPGGVPGIFTGTSTGDLDAETVAYLNSFYGSDPNYSLTDNGDGTWTITRTDPVGDATQISSPGGTGGGTNPIGGAFVRMSDDIIGSTVTVNGNLTEGLVTGNTAENTLSVSANTISDATGYSGAVATDADGSETLAQADNMLQSSQFFDSTSGSATVAGAFAIDTVTDNSFSGSTLTIDGNTQRASVVGNEVTSTLTIDVNSLDTSAALQSEQSASSTLTADSDMWVYAPLSVDNSTVDLTNNRNEAVAQANVATSSISVSGNDLSASGSVATVDADGATATSLAFSNDQENNASGAVSATAATTMINEHFADETTSGMVNSTVTVDLNTTVAQADGNRGINTVSVDVNDVSEATVGLQSEQNNAQTIAATATSTIEIELGASGAGAGILGSSAMVDGNVTNALATANAVTNTLNVDSNTITGDSSTSGSVASNTATAMFSLGSFQTNSNTVDATVENLSNRIVVNDGVTGTDGVETSTVSVSGNLLNAQAIANQGTNRIDVDSTNVTDGSVALMSSQSNSGGAVTATVDNVDIGLSAEGDSQSAVLNSAATVSNNRSSALATGNSVNNSIALNSTTLSGDGNDATVDTTTGASATMVLFNVQENTGVITAKTQDVTIGAALNAGDGTAMSGSTVDVNNNRVLSQAVGNAGYNSVTIVANAGDTASYGMASQQTNTGNVIASVTSTTINMAATGGVTGSTSTVSGNSIGSVAVGNSVTNVLTR